MIATLILAAVVTIGAKDKPVMEYKYEDVPFKPYVAQLYTPAGIGMLRDNVADHKHHHGLMFAVAAGGVDFWSETEKCGRQVQRQFSTNATGIVQQLDWTSPAGMVILSEDRTVHLESQPGVTLITWRTRLVSKETVNLTGSHYFGLGARFIPVMDKVGTFLDSTSVTGSVVRGTEKLTPSNWCAYSASVDGKPVTFAMFDHPTNPRHPAQMFTMLQPFSYLSATLNLWKQPIVLKAGQPLVLCYGVAVWDGQPGRDQIETIYQSWLKVAHCP